MEQQRHIKKSRIDLTDTTYRRMVIGILILLGCALYLHTLPFPFVWDGRGYILGNPLIKGFGYYDDLFHISSFAQLDEKLAIPADFVTNFALRPFTYFTFTINYLLGGTDPVGYRACNILIHIFNGIIIYLLLERVLHKVPWGRSPDRFSRRLIPTATALLFLVHPLQTESVIYITQRFTSLATSFYLSTLFLYLCSVTTRNHRRPWLYWASVATLLAGMLTKEVAFTAPLMLLVLERVVLGSGWKPSLRRLLPHLMCLPLIPALVMITSAVQNSQSLSVKSSLNAVNFYNYSITDYALTQLCAICSYLRLLLLPYGQNVDHDYPLYTSLVNGRVILSLTVILLIIISSLLMYRRKPRELHQSLLFLGVLYFFISISVTSSIIPIAELMVERRTYLPSFGAFLALVCAIDLLRIKWSRVAHQKTIVAGFAVWVIMLGGATLARAEVWRTTITFWHDAALKSPGKLRPMLGLVAAYFEHKQYQQAIDWQKKVIELYPDDPNFYVILVELQYLQGLDAEAIQTGVYALSCGGNNPRIYYFLGRAYARMGIPTDAEQAFTYAITLQPDFLDAHLALAEFYAGRKNIRGALEQYRKAAKLDPDNGDLAQKISALEEASATRQR